MSQRVWELVAATKKGNEIISPSVQFENLKEELSKLDSQTVKEIYEEWRSLGQELMGTVEYERLHYGNGGFVSSGDDGFYMDFLNWFIAQGEDLYNAFQKDGSKAVKDYVKKHNLTSSEYLYECMVYAFHPYID